jgi:hypothetical protein
MGIPWKRELEALALDLERQYPDLRLIEEAGQLLFRGSFPIEHEGETLDRFLIQISFPNGPSQWPLIREIGGRIPRVKERHINSNNGDICAEVPEIVLMRGDFQLLDFLNGPVRNFFLGQALVEKGEKWPFGEWDHGKKGLIEAYGKMLGVATETEIGRFLEVLSSENVKGHWLCPCSSGSKIRGCHREKIHDLRQRVTPRIAQQALHRLKTSR